LIPPHDVASKRTTAQITRSHGLFVSFHRAEARSGTHLTEKPTDTSTDTGNGVKPQTIGNAARNAVSRAQGRLAREIAEESEHSCGLGESGHPGGHKIRYSFL